MPPSITHFALESHTGPYENWPAKSRLIVDGALTELRLPGYSLLHQFEIGEGYLLVTDYDCTYEEATNFILLNRSLSMVSSRSISAPYRSFLLDKIEWLDGQNFIAFVSVDTTNEPSRVGLRFSTHAPGWQGIRERIAMWRADRQSQSTITFGGPVYHVTNETVVAPPARR